MLPFDPQDLPDLIKFGYITSRAHPSLPLTIYNYTAKAQFEKHWSNATLACRGLVLDNNYEVISRPLPKFFNLSEYQGELPEGIPSIYEKLDGSLISLFNYQGTWEVASRGSFESEQAEMAKDLLSMYNLAALDKKFTYLFEVIYPSNRIVVDYGPAHRLVLLAAVHTNAGVELDFEAINWPDKAISYPATALSKWLESLDETKLENQEGFILRWPNGFRLKYKLADYVRLHRIITRVQAKDIWECLSEGQDLNKFLDTVPDEFYTWVKETKQTLEAAYDAIESECLRVFKSLEDRATTAKYFSTQKYPSVLFAMLDKKDHGKIIWRIIKPDYQTPFKTND